MAGNKFLKGAAVLGIAGIVVKLLGVFFRIPLSNWVGEEGMSYYGSVYPIYTLLLTISTAGIPVAISRMVSERIAVKNYGGAHRVFHTSLWFLSALGFVTFAFCHFGAGFIENSILHNPGTSLALQAIAPALFLVPVMSAYRGYFQGRQNMNPTAISQTIEQLFRVLVGLGLAYFLLPSGLEAFSAGATFGCTAGAAAGLIVIVLVYILNLPSIRSNIRRNKSKEELEPTGRIIKKILAIAIPITIGAAIFPIMSTIDSVMVMARLQNTGWSLLESRELWGRLSSYCNSLIGLPQVFIQAVVMSMVPAIAAGFKVRDYGEVRANTQFAMRASMIIGFPCAVGMFSLAEPILHLLYPKQLAGATAAVPTFMIMCVGIIFMSSLQTITGALQGVDKQMLPVRNLAIGAVGKIIVTYILVGTHALNVNGAPIGTIVAYVIAAVLNSRDAKKYIGCKFDISLTYIRPGISAALMGLAAFASYKLIFLITTSNFISTMIAIMVGVVVYALLILVTRSITLEEISKLPKGDKLVRIFKKIIK